MSARRGIKWDDVPLGRYSDAMLARRLMTTRQAVCFQRNARGIPPFSEDALFAAHSLTAMEREDLCDLEEALDVLLAEDRVHLTFRVASCVSLLDGWVVATKHARQSGGDGKDKLPRATAFRFRKPGSRQWSAWMSPSDARVWLVRSSWADEATRRIGALCGRGGNRQVRAPVHVADGTGPWRTQ